MLTNLVNILLRAFSNHLAVSVIRSPNRTMGKDSDKKEDSGFGFKDRAKAEETIELLKSHEVGYQRLTVRGLLGRAKRVLSLTKAEDKIKNIKEAMEVFEKWLQDYEKEHPPKNPKPSSKTASEKKKKASSDEESEDSEEEEKDKKKDEKTSSDTVPGLGFKDKDKAVETIKLLEGRDPDYQKLAVKGLIGRAKRVLTCTRDKDKVQNIKDAMDVFEKFLDDFEKMNLTKQNMSYLPLSVLESCQVLVKKHKLSSGKYEGFLEAYKKTGGDYKKLRTVEDKASNVTWDIIRNKELKEIKKKVGDSKLFEDNGNPTRDHLKMIVWAYSPEDIKMKRLKIAGEDVDMKDDSSSAEKKKDSSEKKKDSSDRKSSSDKKKESPERKRRRSSSNSSSGSDSEDSPRKKKK